MLHIFSRYRLRRVRLAAKTLSQVGAVAALTAVTALALAGCSGQGNQHAGVDKQHLTTPPQSTMNAINNAPPPPLNLPANMPQDEKNQIIAQQQQDIANQNAARNRMFASMGMPGGPKGKN